MRQRRAVAATANEVLRKVFAPRERSGNGQGEGAWDEITSDRPFPACNKWTRYLPNAIHTSHPTPVPV